MENRMTEQNPQTAPEQPPASQAQQPAAPGGEKQPPWGKPENFDAEKAWELIQNLRTEKGDPSLKTELDALRQQQEQQRTALAAALGVKPEETSDTEKLAQTLSTLQQQILASEKRALAAEHKIPAEFHHLLTATESEALKQQAEALVQFAQAAHYAASTTSPPAAPPAFQQNPGQGQGGGPLTPEAQAAAEYEKYYPSR